MANSLFPRSFLRHYPLAVRGEGVYLFDAAGKKYLDACGGPAVVTIGYGVAEVVHALAEQAARLPYVHSSQFHTQVAAELAALLCAQAPGGLGTARVYFTSGGSEATETAIKLVRQYWLEQGQAQRYKIVSRWQSYHGSTLGALSLSGNKRRRWLYAPLLPDFGHISACYCYRCPLGQEFPACELGCAQELEEAIVQAGPETVAGFILEPIVGATTGAVPPEGYLRTIREICNKYELLLIADEVLTGMGRTGKYFAVEHWHVAPDLILLGKGLTSGYAPLGAVVVAEKVWSAIRSGSGAFEHGFTYQSHPISVAAGLAAQNYIRKMHLVEQAAVCGEYLSRGLESLRELPSVGEVRGKGLLQSIEFVAERATRAPFPPEEKFSEQLFEALRERGVLVYPMKGTADGWAGDHIMITPPFVIGKSQIDFLVDKLGEAISQVAREVGSLL